MANQVKIQPTGGEPGKVSPEMFTKERVNELMKRRVERSHNAFFNRYGVKDLNELDDLFGKAVDSDKLKADLEAKMKEYSELESKFNNATAQNADLTKKYAFLSKNINPGKYSDIETYFKGKNLAINEDTLAEELKTHADWCNKSNPIVSLGSEVADQTSVDEKAMASRYLGVNLD